MAEFCGSDLWNWNVTWNTENPDFTPCFEKTVLAWAACAFLWTAGTVEFAFRIRRTAKRTNHRTFLNTTQRLLTVALIIIEILGFAFAFRKRRDPNSHAYPVDKVTPAVKAVSFAFALTLQYVNKWKGVASSGVLFTFWFLEAFFGALRFQTAIRHLPSEDEYTHHRFTLLVVSFPLIVAQLFLHFFSHSEQDQHNVLNSGGTGVHRPCPEKRLSFPVRITFQWFWSMAIVGFKRPLEIKDLWDLNPEDKSKVLVERFNSTWRHTLDASLAKSVTQSTKKYKDANDDRFGRKIVSILPVLWRCNQRTLLLGGLSKFISDMLIFVSPSILDLLIEHVEAEEERWKSYFYAALLYINVTLQILFLGQYFRNTFITGMRTRSSIIGAIYQKALLVSNTARKESTVGDIVNLMSVDTQKLADSPMFLHILWTAPIQITLAMYFLWTTLGPSILAGVAVLLTLIPSNIWILRRVKRLQVRQMKLKDMRVKLMSEILAGMKVLKLYAWEPFFEDQIQSIRRQEMEFLRTEAFFNSLSSFIWFIAPFLVSLVTFATYVLIDEKNVLDPRKAFVSLTYFNILKPPMTILPNALVSVMQAAVSVKRLSRFMNAEEIDSNAVARSHSSDGSAGVSINDGNFSWGQRPILRNINLKAEKGSLLAIIGTVGSGKSSLLSAVLGEMVKESGTVNTKGSIAYVAQQAWIQNATLRDNILFGKKFDEDRYERVVSACALKPDLKILPGGDRIEIGEMGINLSGGQKQRVSLARAVYQDADIYILDDPLSAVDAHVGRHLFDEVIGPSGMLRSKTRLVVTHSVTYLSQMDAIAVMSDGEIVELGTFHELMELKGVLAELVAQHSIVEDEEAAQPLDAIEDTISEVHVDSESEKQEQGDNTSRRSSDSSMSDAANEKLITIEKAQTGSIQADVYKYFIRSFSVKLAACTLSIFVVLHVLSLLSSIWLAEWSNVEPTNGTQDPMTRDLYLGVYGGYGLGQAIASFAGNVALALGCLQASGLLHNNMLSSILRAPMSFFDTTPLGRIVNRFSRDVDVMDNTFPGNLRTFIIYLFQVISTLIVISYSIPLFLLVVFPIGVLYYAVQRFYVASSRQLKRLESLTRSPVYSHFSETLTGTSTIRAFGVQRQFIEHSERKVDYNQMTYYPSIIANRWVGFNLETLGNLIVLFAALLAVISDRDQSSLGLSVSYALTITQALKWLVRVSADVEMNVVSVERLKEYGEVEQEAAWNLPDRSPPENWPTKGEVKFVKYETRYREGLDLILRGITCTIMPGEKVGIVGRTGAGKSSLTLALFRVIEASGGSIEIDGHTLADLGLHDVRSRLTIIPQDPVLFAGSLRMNLDPADKYSDEEIWRALEHAHLNDFAKSLPLGLSYEIMEGGGNLSVGQRQLVCLARALLRKTKILILDEATAAVDLDTDDLIQRTIRSEFKGCTVLTIAHRLKTIMDYDRVMVLDKGEIREFASPSELLADPHSIFFGMAKNSSAA